MKQTQNLEILALQLHSLICCAHPAKGDSIVFLDLIKPQETLTDNLIYIIPSREETYPP